jgi:hypothetical protein
MFLPVIKEHSHDFKIVVMLQNCMGLIKDEPDSGTLEARVKTLDSWTEEGNIKVESVDLNKEDPETFEQMSTESEVSVWCLCVRQQVFMLSQNIYCHKREHLKTTFYQSICKNHAFCIVYCLEQPIHK